MTLSVNSPCNIIFVNFYVFFFIKVKDNISATKKKKTKKKEKKKVKDNNIYYCKSQESAPYILYTLAKWMTQDCLQIVHRFKRSQQYIIRKYGYKVGTNTSQIGRAHV